MKKALSLVLASLLALTAVGCNSGEDHQHNYSVKDMNDIYLASEASCMAGRLYFYACSVCGRSSGDETDPNLQYIWQGSDALGHELTPEGCTREGCSFASKDNGTLANGMQWAFYPDGTLYFFGSGALPDWSEEEMRAGSIPWMSYAVRKIELPKTITSVGDRSFAGLASLKTVELPWGVTSVGESAFEGCSSLSALTLPDSLNIIGKNAFRSCSALTAITLPRYAASIDGNAFAGCSGLTAISVAEGNSAYSVIGGCLVEKVSGTLITAPTGYAVPASGVTAIGASAFEGRTDLTAIHIPASVTAIGEKAFFGCTNLVEIGVDAASQHFVSKGNCLIERSTKRLLQGCSTSQIPVDGSVTEIGDYAFAGCRGLTSIHIPVTVNTIAGTAFTGCSGLESITASTGNTHYNAIDNCLIVSGTRTLLLGCKNSVIPADGSVIRIGNGAFAGSGVTTLAIPDAVTEIGEAAFEDCTSLESLTVGSGITSAQALNPAAFDGCSSLGEIKVSENHPAFVVLQGCLIDQTTATLLLGSNNAQGKTEDGTLLNVTSIGAYAFAGRTLESFFIPKTVTSIGDFAFYGCKALSGITYEGDSEAWTSVTLGNAWYAFTAFKGKPSFAE